MKISFRLYAELNDYLPPAEQGKEFAREIADGASVGQAIESLPAPIDKIDLILIDGRSVSQDQPLTAGDRLALYPVFERFDIGPAVQLREAPLRTTCFVADVHLGKLARFLLLLGLDCRYQRTYEGNELVEISRAERRIILTKSNQLAAQPGVTHCHVLRAASLKAQLVEVVAAFQLSAQLRPFTRCMCCNAALESCEREAVVSDVPPPVTAAHDRFLRCPSCERIYWQGSHYRRMMRLVQEILADAGGV